MARKAPVAEPGALVAAQPVNAVTWRDRADLTANDYNPNKVAPPELALLKISIMEDGWTQPIVATPDGVIVDGYHRWIVSGDEDVYALTDGLVPVVTLVPKDTASQQMATIRHNRARGSHHVVRMADLVTSMVDAGYSAEEIGTRMQMEPDEVERLARHGGILLRVDEDGDWSKPWAPTRDARASDVDLEPARLVDDDVVEAPGGDETAEADAR